MLTWAATASWLWPQLATAVGWMTHRRSSLPSVTWAAFLLLLTEGLLQACQLVAHVLARAGQLIPRHQGDMHSKARPTYIQTQKQSWLR